MNTDDVVQERPWWAQVRVMEFRERIATLPYIELCALKEEISGMIGSLQTQIETRGKTDPAWWARARAALGYTIEKRQLVVAQITRVRHGDALQAVFDVRGKAEVALMKLRAGDDRGCDQLLDAIVDRLKGV